VMWCLVMWKKFLEVKTRLRGWTEISDREFWLL
jgi:hypothetical protein